MKYILFIVMLSGDITTAEFNNKHSCEMASLRAETRMLSDTVNNFPAGITQIWCSPKGLEK